MRRAATATGATVAGVSLMLALKPHQVTGSAGRVVPAAERAGRPVTGVFTGDVARTPYGPVQVRIQVTGGRLTAVRVLRVPRGRPRAAKIASFAVPILTARALAAGGARIDTVSGATYTSRGYIASLQSALDRAGA